ncbi:hypothetical protein GQ602_006801 [Ophiocordyceps camponoti-floridani]|uniref:Uncharacterized protein n=1 Tax=Ophiocordyceps camponoti-floridani TaxID=2030778 RepID=A0A8H4Q1Z6_9HYPO|nr:hypothetical protein GQ602_006801 [Ophiocordyceps camponoti-floridani]
MASQHTLSLIGPKDTSPNGSRDDSPRVTQQKNVGSLSSSKASNGTNGPKQRRKVRGRPQRTIMVIIMVIITSGRSSSRRSAKQSRKPTQPIVLVSHLSSKRPLPHGQQGPSLRDARPPRYGADDGRVELIVQLDEGVWIAVSGEEEGEGGGGCG